MVGKILFRGIVVSALLLTVASAYIIGEDNLIFGVDVSDKGMGTVTFGTTVTAAGILVRLEYKSELIHNCENCFRVKTFAFSALLHFDG